MPYNADSMIHQRREEWKPIAATVREIMSRRGISYRVLADELGDGCFHTTYGMVAKGRCPTRDAEARKKRVLRWIAKHSK